MFDSHGRPLGAGEGDHLPRIGIQQALVDQMRAITGQVQSDQAAADYILRAVASAVAGAFAGALQNASRMAQARAQMQQFRNEAPARDLLDYLIAMDIQVMLHHMQEGVYAWLADDYAAWRRARQEHRAPTDPSMTDKED